MKKMMTARAIITQPKKYEQVIEYFIDYKPSTEMEKKALSLVRDLQAAGFAAFFVGGFVRDIMLGEKVKDIDIATSARPGEVINFARTNNLYFSETNKEFGMVRLVKEGEAFEVTTFRTDGTYSDQRRPDEVKFTSELEEDAKRRDFTFNSLYFNPLERRVVDFFGGLSDLQKGILRFVGEPEKILAGQYDVAKQRIREDPLRIVRAVRFAARFNLQIDSAAEKAMLESKDLLETAEKNKTGVSWERKSQELNAMWLDKNRYKAFKMIDKFGLWKYLLPEINSLKGVEQGDKYHQEGDVFEHISLGMKKVGEVLSDNDFKNHFDKNAVLKLTWAWLLHDIGKPRTKKNNKGRITFYKHDQLGVEKARAVLERFSFSKKDLINPVIWMISKHMNVRNLGRTEKKSKLLEYFSHPDFFPLLGLLKLDSLASLPVDLSDYQMAFKKYKDSLAEGILEKGKHQKGIINGQDIINLGFSQGPVIGIIKKIIIQAFVEGKIKDKNQAIVWLKKNQTDLRDSLSEVDKRDNYNDVVEKLYYKYF